MEEEYPGHRYQELFDHMSEEHGLTLLQSEMDQIVAICLRLQGIDPYGNSILKSHPSPQ